MFHFHTQKFETAAERVAAAALPAGERQWMVEHLLFEYPLFTKVTEEIGRFHHPVQGGTPGRGLLGGILGEARSGKSYICKHYVGGHPFRVEDYGEVYPVIYLEARADWSPHHMAEQIFLKTGAKSVPTMKTAALITAALRRLIQAKTELVVVDDTHFLLLESKGAALRGYRSLLKGIADLESCNVLLAGLPGLQQFVEDDAQLCGRGDFPHWHTKPLDWAINDEREQFVLLLHGIDERLPFRNLSGLSAPSHVADFYHSTGGMIGRVMNIVKDAAQRAINADSAFILPEHLAAAADPRMRVGETYRAFRGGHPGGLQ